MARNNELIRLAKKAAGTWRNTHEYQQAAQIIDMLVDELEKSTLTQPNEWVRVETPPTEQGWYHVAILDLKTGKYKVEQDLYAIGLAKIYGFEPGFCKENRWGARKRIDYWCKFPSPPDRRPPEGEEEEKHVIEITENL